MAAGYRSGLEEVIADQITKSTGVEPRYECPESVVRYVTPMVPHRHTPDFVLPNGIIIETKGRFVTADRKKHLLIQKQHPEKDIRFVFSNSRTRISKLSKTTYADWCTKHGFKYADKFIPQEWFDEKKSN